MGLAVANSEVQEYDDRTFGKHLYVVTYTPGNMYQIQFSKSGKKHIKPDIR